MSDDLLAVDLGGTQMRAAIVSATGEIRERRAQPTPQDAPCPEALMVLAGDVLARREIREAVIGVPGRVDYRRGRLEHAPNLPEHWPAALDERTLRDRLGVHVSIANDADMAAVGEALFGAGRGYDDVVYLTVSTGVGAGALLNGRLVHGRRSAVEAGHTVVNFRALEKGQPATLEDLGSGTALARRAAEAGLEPDARCVAERVRRGDRVARTLWDELVNVIAVGIINLAYLFTPEAVVLGGGVGRNADLLLEPIRDRLRRHGPPGLADAIEVTVAEHGNDAGLVGAAGWHVAIGKERK